jgi:membrane-bound lytic murein transglycosylase B
MLGMTLQKFAFRFAVVIAMTAVTLYGSAFADYTAREDVRQYIAELVDQHDFDSAELLELFARAERKESIRRAMSRPAEKMLKWHEYRQIFVKEPRISQGFDFWVANEATLARAEAEFGVPPEYIVAIIGVETRYGRIVGSYRVVDALATLAFDYPPEAGRSRADFFRKELTEFLLLAREEGKDPLSLQGSYAGAMGYGQFIPSSFRAYAVDFDGDGLRDIWSNQTDAIGSVANYFSAHGWRQGEPTVEKASLRADVDLDELNALANSTLKPERSIGSLAQLGLQVDGLDDDELAAVFRMIQADDVEYWLGLHNFYVITRYNRSRLYSLAVHQLAQMLRERYDASRGGVRAAAD